MSGQTVILTGPASRTRAAHFAQIAPDGAVCTIREASRSGEQNAKMWAMLSDVARAKPEDRHWTTDVWKAAFMHHLGHEVQFCEGLDNKGPFPVGFRSSRLSKGQMADLITTIQEYGDRHGVAWSVT